MPDWTNSIQTGDCFDVLDELPAESAHAVVTDPPYAEGDYDGFMGRDWDSFDGPRAFQEWNRDWASAAKRVLKPGGHLLAFGSDDGHHRTACGIEDAGFEIRTHINWIYGSGFPKALDVSKSIDKRAGAWSEREVVGENPNARDGHSKEADYEFAGGSSFTRGAYNPITAPATDAAKRWDGWKTGLKPATEFVVLARKPLGEGTVAENVQQWGTGALNIDGCRIQASDNEGFWPGEEHQVDDKHLYGDGRTGGDKRHEQGRYPANVVFDEQAAEQLDREVGELDAGARTPQSSTGRNTSDASTHNDPDERRETDAGGPSRYYKVHEWRDTDREMQRLYYTSKATKSERTLDGRIANAHPTVKPKDLMKWLVRLVTRTTAIRWRSPTARRAGEPKRTTSGRAPAATTSEQRAP